ncbi:hypothetical protein [Flavobacterium caeni]|uniref:hypothetical protein n=1 Tax=Flavobacterium caeni TaxID=490189 RepID=UPI00111315C0|nr:hypothetical protein [Flavobacterium caeni]
MEKDEKYILAYEEYKKAYFKESENFDLWKNYYFFLWYIMAEDTALKLTNFIKQNSIETLLPSIASDGIKKYKLNPEALFILGYTVSLFPYFFGEYLEWEEKGKSFLESAYNLSSSDKIYKLAYLGSIYNQENKDEYDEICLQAANEVKSRFSGNGLLNSYFSEVLYRIDRASQ